MELKHIPLRHIDEVHLVKKYILIEFIQSENLGVNTAKEAFAKYQPEDLTYNDADKVVLENKNITGEAFDWLYIDFDTLSMYALQYGFECEKCIDGEHYDYLARLTAK